VKTIGDYIVAAAPEARRPLREIRKAVKRAVPKAEETIGYRMPALRLGRIFMYFAAFRKHIGIFPPVKDKALTKALLPYRGVRGNLKFPLDQKIPYPLIGRVAKALARQYAKKPK
jgi:uncharacterized protein YdhG (YjbR/CyaY superfamily)